MNSKVLTPTILYDITSKHKQSRYDNVESKKRQSRYIMTGQAKQMFHDRTSKQKQSRYIMISQVNKRKKDILFYQ